VVRSVGVLGGGPSGMNRVMLFIDGGYLRKNIDDRYDAEINYGKFAEILTGQTSRGSVTAHMIRAYYYDAIASPKQLATIKGLDEVAAKIVSDELYFKEKKQELYFDKIRLIDSFDVRLGRLVWVKNGDYRQKGVDSLIAIDMITKAYESQYDEAILIAGDADFVEIVKAVKSVGARVTGAYFQSSASKDLVDEFDRRIPLDGGLSLEGNGMIKINKPNN